MRQVAWFTAVSLATIMAVGLVWEFRVALLLFILSLTIAAIVRPVVDRLFALGLPRGLALSLTYLSILVMILLLGFAFSRPLFSDLQQLSRDLPAGYQQLRSRWLAGGMLQQTIASMIPETNDFFQILTGGDWNAFIKNSWGFTMLSLDMLSKVVIVLALSIYWTADQEYFKRLWLSLLPLDWRARSRDIWESIEREIGAYLRSELIQSLLTFIILGISYQLIGLNYPFLLALIGAVGWLIVWFGGIIAVIPGLLVGFAINPLIGILAAVFTIAVLAFLEFVLEPRLFDHRHISSLLVVIMVLILVKQYGVVGFFLAPPLAASIQIIMGHLIHPTVKANIPIPPPPAIQIDLLRERLSSLKKTFTIQAEPPPPDILNLVDRLDGLIEQANQDEQIAG